MWWTGTSLFQHEETHSIARGFLLPLLSAVLPTIANLILRNKWERKHVTRDVASPSWSFATSTQAEVQRNTRGQETCKTSPVEKWFKMRQKWARKLLDKRRGQRRLRIFLRRVIPTSAEPAGKPTCPPYQKTRRGTQTDETSASVTTSPPPPVIPSTSKEFKYQPPKQEGDDDGG